MLLWLQINFTIIITTNNITTTLPFLNRKRRRENLRQVHSHQEVNDRDSVVAIGVADDDAADLRGRHRAAEGEGVGCVARQRVEVREQRAQRRHAAEGVLCKKAVREQVLEFCAEVEDVAEFEA